MNVVLYERVTPKKCLKMQFWWHFTAKNESKWCLLDLNFCRSVSQCQINIAWPFSDKTQCFWACKIHLTVKNAIFTVFYDFLQHEMLPDDVCLTWIVAWECLSDKLTLFDYFLTRLAVFECIYLKNVIFTAHYGFLRRFLEKIPTEFFVSCMVISV